MMMMIMNICLKLIMTEMMGDDDIDDDNDDDVDNIDEKDDENDDEAPAESGPVVNTHQRVVWTPFG